MRRARHARVEDRLSGVALFAGFPARALRPLAAHVDRLRLPAGTVLADAGDQLRQVVLVVDGTAGVRRADGSTWLWPGDRPIGAAAASASSAVEPIVALTDVEVVVLPTQAYRWAQEVLHVPAA